MRVVRGRGPDPEADRAVTARLVEDVGATGDPALRVWQPHRQVAFGRRDVRSDGFDAAAAAARERDYRPIERSVGGRAVAYTGTTVAFARIQPIDDVRSGLDDRYDDAVADVRRALADVGVDAERGEPPDAFCPGQHSLSAAGKIAGIAQRVRTDAAMVGGVVVPDDHRAVGAVLEPVYEALSVPFDPGSVGSVARAGGDPDGVVAALETRLAAGHDTTVERVDG